MNKEVRCVIDSRSALGEAPLWNQREEKLYWVDIDAGIVHIFDPGTGKDRSIPAGMKVGAAVPRAPGAGGGLLLAAEQGFCSFDPETGQVEKIADPEAENADTRFNDGKCDPGGRFWAGTMSYSRTRGAANLWCLDTDYSVSRRVSGVTVSNGLAWSLDEKKMYYIDSSEFAVVAFDYDKASGEISYPRPAVLVPRSIGKPDGMCIDAEGMLWIALFRGAAVSRWDPSTGELIELIEIPCRYVTSCTFGGTDLGTLYVTTARGPAATKELSTYPESGGVFAVVNPGVTGVPSFEFGG